MKRVAQESLRRRVQPYLEMLVRIEVAKAIEQSPDLAAKYLPTSPEQIDLIVIPRHSHRSVAGYFFGRTAENLSRIAPCPVLAFSPNEG